MIVLGASLMIEPDDKKPGARKREPPEASRRRQGIGQKRPVTVVGAGFSGLVTAFYLSRAGFQVDVIEASDRAGGLISTTQTQFGLVESAANAFLNSSRVEELFGLLGLDVVPTQSEAKKRYVFRWGQARRWPLSFMGSIRLIPFIVMYFIFKKSVAPNQNESIRDWATRVMGAEAAQYLVEAALQGIYAGDPTQLSARLILARFFQPKSNDPKPKLRGSISAPEGMGQVVEKLRETLLRQGVQFVFQHRYRISVAEPRWPVVVATSVKDAAEILREVDPIRAKACANIETLPIVSVTVGFCEAPPAVRGFGCLFPPVESRRVLGVLMNKYIFPDRCKKGFSETWILGGARSKKEISGDIDLMSKTDQELIGIAIEERQAVLQASAENHGARVSRWPDALPHYSFKLEESLPELRGMRRNVVLMGNYLGAIGLARILDQAAKIPEEVAAKGEWRI